MRLLVTRPEPDAARTAEVLRAQGHTVLVAPLMRTETIAADFGGPFAAVLLTSANAARALAAHPRKAELLALPAFAVGARSAEAARDTGFTQVTSADGALGDLVRLIAPRFGGCRAGAARGADRRRYALLPPQRRNPATARRGGGRS
jgi:uroporphyrinogen-III synthase